MKTTQETTQELHKNYTRKFEKTTVANIAIVKTFTGKTDKSSDYKMWYVQNMQLPLIKNDKFILKKCGNPQKFKMDFDR